MAVRILEAKAGLLVVAGGAFLILGELFEKLVSIANHTYYEEISELFSYVLIVLSALAVNELPGYLKHSGGTSGEKWWFSFR